MEIVEVDSLNSSGEVGEIERLQQMCLLRLGKSARKLDGAAEDRAASFAKRIECDSVTDGFSGVIENLNQRGVFIPFRDIRGVEKPGDIDIFEFPDSGLFPGGGRKGSTGGFRDAGFRPPRLITDPVIRVEFSCRTAD